MKKKCGLFFVLIGVVCCVVVSAEDAFRKIDPDCYVWIARRKTITTQVQPLLFVTLQNVRGLGEERVVSLYFPENVNLDDELEAMKDRSMAEKVRATVLRQMNERQKPISEWIPVAPVKRLDGENLKEPTLPGYYWANLRIDSDNGEEYLRMSRVLVVVARKKNGTLAAMQSGSTYAAPLKDYCRWGGRVSVEKANDGKLPRQ